MLPTHSHAGHMIVKVHRQLNASRKSLAGPGILNP
jgi:hypothetical protein